MMLVRNMKRGSQFFWRFFQRLIPLSLLSLSGTQLCGAQTMPLVDFQAATTQIPQAQISPRSWTEFTSSRALLPLLWDQPTFLTGTPPSQPAFFSGVDIRSLGDASNVDTKHVYLKLNDNDPPEWPNEPAVFLACTESSQGQQAVHLTWVNLWTKPLFQGMADPSSRVLLSPGSRLAVTYSEWLPESPEPTFPSQIRFIIRNAGITYLSEFVWSQPITQPKSIVLENPASTRWAPVTWTADSFRIPESLAFQQVEFEDVEAVGFVQQNASKFMRLIRWNRFEFHAEPASGPASFAWRPAPLLDLRVR